MFARGVWELFAKDFPVVQEQSLIPPHFETFGGSNLQPNFQLQFGAPIGSRLWLFSENSNHLVQFQPDRFLANWRKSPNPHPYPRFEGISEAFESNLNTLNQHLTEFFGQGLDINQAEVSYINIIPVSDFSEAGQWFSLWGDNQLSVETLNSNFTEVIRDSDGKPLARLHYEIQSVFTVDGNQKAFRLNLTFRGKPIENNVASAMRFLARGRETIVTRFSAITTNQAHKNWERTS